MLATLLEQTITGLLPKLKNSRKGWKTQNCPLCILRGHSQDKKGRFGIHISSEGIGINCFNCAFHAIWTINGELSKDFCWFLTAISVPQSDVNKLKFQAFREKEAGQIFSAPKLEGNIFSKWIETPLPENANTLTEWKELGCTDTDFLQTYDYAISRGLSPNDMYWSPARELLQCKRLIMPFYYNDKLIGHTDRYNKETSNKSIRRYINTMPDNFVYNLDRQRDNRKYVILCEGVIDAYLTDGISSLGSINKTQIDIINSIGKEIIVCPDRDKEGNPLVDAAIENKWAVSFPRWDKEIKDAGRAYQIYGKLLTLNTIITFAEWNPLKIKISRKMDKFNE